MVYIFATVMMLLGPALVVVLTLAVLVLAGIVVRDLFNWSKAGDVARANHLPDEEAWWHRTARDTERRMKLERGFARSFVILGGVFWACAAFAGYYSFRQSGVTAAFVAGCIPAFAAAFTLIIGWYWERIASAMLAMASLVVIAWGVFFQFELGVWVLMAFSLIGPMVTAAVLFWLARGEHEALEVLHATRPEPALATVTVSN